MICSNECVYFLQTQTTSSGGKGQLLEFSCHQENNTAVCQVDHVNKILKSTGSQASGPRFEMYEDHFPLRSNVARCSAKMEKVLGLKESVFNKLLNVIPDYEVETYESQEVNRRNPDLLLMFLMRLRLDLNLEAITILLALKFDVLDAQDYFLELLEDLHKTSTERIHWPSQSESRAQVPSSLKPYFTKCRVIVNSIQI